VRLQTIVKNVERLYILAYRYYPLGSRSNAGVRGEWGEFKNYGDYLDTVNNGLVIAPMIEANRSLENLDVIASVAGVDALLIGPSDLSIELGVPRSGSDAARGFCYHF
jgi:2-keto-3-deoxy-L-rhamnonate aldolase RhmA